MVLAATLGLFGALWPFADEIEEVRYRTAPGWLLVVEKDNFSGEMACAAQSRRVLVRRNVATFSLGSRVNTAQAEFLLDGGPAVWAREVGLEVAGQGVRLLDGSVKNPTGGHVHVPLATLASATQISIRPDRDRRAVTFPLAGLHQTLAAGKAHGCRGL